MGYLYLKLNNIGPGQYLEHDRILITYSETVIRAQCNFHPWSILYDDDDDDDGTVFSLLSCSFTHALQCAASPSRWVLSN